MQPSVMAQANAGQIAVNADSQCKYEPVDPLNFGQRRNLANAEHSGKLE